MINYFEGDDFLSSAFRNFFITFAICLIVFGFVGFQYVLPWLNDVFDFSDMNKNPSSDVSSDVSGDNSESENKKPPVEENFYDPEGDVFTAVIMAVDGKGSVVNCVFIDSNAKTKQLIYCPISPETRRVNEVGVLTPVKNLFANMSPYEVCQCVSAMTGIEVDYCITFDRDGVQKLASSMPGAYVKLPEGQSIDIINPAYKDYVSIDGSYPSDYRAQITNVDGKVNLNENLMGKTKLQWLLEYAPEGASGEYNDYYRLISKAILNQFLENEANNKNTKSMTAMINASKSTNMTASDASAHLETIFAFDTFEVHDVIYPENWETAVRTFRELDGSYSRKESNP